MRLVKLSLVAVATVLLAGCSDSFFDDPLHSYPDNVRNGIPKKTEKPKRPAIDKNAVRIDCDELLSVTEGVAGVFKIRPRIMIENVKGRLEFSGFPKDVTHKYDDKTGDFTLTVPGGFTNGEFSVRFKFTARIVTDTDVGMSVDEEIPVVVYSSMRVPEIYAISGLSDVKEGEYKDFFVLVKDLDSAGRADKRPTLVVSPFQTSLGFKDGSWLVSVIGDPTYTNIEDAWKFKLRIDARYKELTTDSTSYAFNLVAVNQFGVRSPSKRADLTVQSQVKLPNFTWKSKKTQMLMGQLNRLTFSVYDANDEGEISFKMITDLASLPGQASVTCAPRDFASKAALDCAFTWDLTTALVREGDSFELTFEITNKGKFNFETDRVNRTLVVAKKIGPSEAGENP